MGPIEFVLHLINLLAPALAVAAGVVLAGRHGDGARTVPRSAWARWGLLACGGSVVLVAGLWWFGRDGKMLTYGLLVVTVASGQWLMQGRWKR